MKRLPIETAPKDGRLILAICKRNYNNKEYYKFVSWGIDQNDPSQWNDDQKGWGEMWLDDTYDDFSCGMAACPHDPIAWIDIPELNKD